jgi:hypothetical protein
LESTSTSPVSRIAEDIKLLSDTTQLLSITLPSNIKSLRLGRANNKNPRPLKVIFPSKEQALKCINDFNVGRRSQDVPNLTISVARDRTLLERQEIRRIYSELDNRKKSGELNITIRYRNGIPTIVSTIQGFDSGHSSTYRSALQSKN